MEVIHSEDLKSILVEVVDATTHEWIEEKISKLVADKSAKDLYLTYSLLSGKVAPGSASAPGSAAPAALRAYLAAQNASAPQLARVYLLSRALEADGPYFRPEVANLIQVADTGELETFLKFLVLLPDPGAYKRVAVEALRTNVATVFDAISAGNPYPSAYFDDREWNQMYLKAAFMQRDLARVPDVELRANRELARIISDYAHERWAAGREVDPLFWRPVGAFLDDALVGDMRRLLQSGDAAENRAAALCCYGSENREAATLLEAHPRLRAQVANGELAWSKLNE